MLLRTATAAAADVARPAETPGLVTQVTGMVVAVADVDAAGRGAAGVGPTTARMGGRPRPWAQVPLRGVDATNADSRGTLGPLAL